MGSSLLLGITRNSMLEVYQAKRLIDTEELLKNYPVLQTPIDVEVTIYLEDEPFSSYKTNSGNTLLENII